MNLENLLAPYPVLKRVGSVADKLALEAYVVGGFVRDLLLKKKSCDVDIVCLGSGAAFAKSVAEELGIDTVSEFKNFGTAMIKTPQYEIEFVGARKESYSRNSRKPIVESGSLEDDQRRRDFTMNALAISLNEKSWGELLDPFDGVMDLEKKILKTPLDPEMTFSDDPLRMMRAVRFAVQLGLQIEERTMLGLRAQSSRIEIISKERITAELNKIIASQQPSRGFRLLDEAALLGKIFPEIVALKGTEVIDGLSHKENFDHTLKVLDNTAEKTKDLWLRWAAILHDIAKPNTKKFEPGVGFTFHGHDYLGAKMVPKIFKNLRLPMNAHMQYVQKLVRLHLRPIALVKDCVTDSAVRRLIHEAGDDIDSLMLLCRADITSENGSKVQQYLKNFDKVSQKIAELEESDRLRNFQPVITGEIIMKALNLKPSAEVGKIKIAIREAILEGHIKNEYAEAYDYMMELAMVMGVRKTA